MKKKEERGLALFEVKVRGWEFQRCRTPQTPRHTRELLGLQGSEWKNQLGYWKALNCEHLSV